MYTFRRRGTNKNNKIVELGYLSPVPSSNNKCIPLNKQLDFFGPQGSSQHYNIFQFKQMNWIKGNYLYSELFLDKYSQNIHQCQLDGPKV